MKAKVNKVTIEIVMAGLLQQDVVAIVHTTDPSLTVSPWLAEKAGASVQRECLEIGYCDVGAAVVTGAGNMKYEKIIHAVAPRWGESSARGKLANVTWDVLRHAEASKLKSVAMPAISIGALGYPVENCAKMMIGEIIDFTFESLKHLRNIVVCLETKQSYEAFEFEFNRQIQILKDTGEGQVRV